MDKETVGLLALMLNGFPQSQNTDADATMMGLEMVLTDLSRDAIHYACRQFMTAKVDGHDIRFAPSIAQFYQVAESRNEYLKLMDRPRLAMPVKEPDVPITDEERERMKPRIDAIWKQFKLQNMPEPNEKIEYTHDPDRPTDHLIEALNKGNA